MKNSERRFGQCWKLVPFVLDFKSYIFRYNGKNVWLKGRETVVDKYIIYYFFIMMTKKRCLKCWEKRVKKDWKMRWKQRYKCIFCGYVFQNASKKVCKDQLWNEYIWWRQTYQQLSEKYKISIRTIQKRLDEVIVKKKS